MSLESKLAAYFKSPASKKKINAKIHEYHSSGEKRTASGSSIVPEDRMAHASAKFMELLHQNAMACNLPASVMQHIEDMASVRPIPTKDGFELPIFFGGDLHRDSLENDDTSYDGIDNIVALFNNGYHASDYVYGWWDNHSPSGAALGRSLYKDDYAWVRSVKDREALRFIQQTIADFNGNYGADYDVTAVAANIYTE